MIEILDFNIRGRKDLTRQCFSTMRNTLDWPNVWVLILDASLENEEPITSDDMLRWVPPTALGWTLLHYPGYGTGLGWNTSIKYAYDSIRLTDHSDPHDYHVWQMNNDLIFNKSGWLEKMSAELHQPGVGEVASGDMQVFGHHFVTGAVAGFNLGTIFEVIPSGEIMDPKLNYAYGDVALSVLIERHGLKTKRVHGIEWGDDPCIVHLISQTMYSREGYENVIRYRQEEAKLFIDRFGRRDGKTGYEDI